MATGTTPEFTPESTRHTLDVACSKAGLDSSGAELMRLGENALYRLAGRPAVVRIARSMGSWKTAVKEVNVARWLESSGFGSAGLTSPTDQPLEADGHPVTFWRFIDGKVAAPQDVGLLGETLRRLHSLPPPNNFKLPTVDILEKVYPRISNAPLSDGDRSVIRRRCERLEEELRKLQFPLSRTVVHGDAHIKNLMIKDDFPILIDFENMAWGQPEWDLSMTATEYVTAGWWTQAQYGEFCAAYGFDITQWEGFPVLRATHEIKMTTWIMQNVEHSADIRREFNVRMASIKGQRTGDRWTAF